MTQTKLESFIETMINVISGFIVSMIIWQFFVAPLYNIPVTLESNIGITAIFTITSIIRSYYWRRFFAVGLHKKIHNLVLRIK
jgi:hypothetical protein